MNNHGLQGAARHRRAAAPAVFALLALSALAVAGLWLLAARAQAASAPGTALWTRTYGSSAHLDDSTVDIAVYPNGDLCQLGLVASGDSPAADPHIRLARYTSSGTLVWQRFYRGKNTEAEWPVALAVNRYGDAFALATASNGTDTRIVVLRYDSTGHRIWVRSNRGPSNGDASGADVAVDAKGNCYIVGAATRGSSSTDLLVAKLSRAGKLLWTRYWTNPTAKVPSWATALAVYPGGRVAACGVTRLSAARYRWVTVVFDSHGMRLWAHQLLAKGNVDNRADDIALADHGAIYVGGTVVRNGRRLACLVRYTSKGRLQWRRFYWGGKACELGAKVAVDADGNAILGATTVNPGFGDTWAVMMLSAAGNRVWLYESTDPGDQNEHLVDVATNRAGTVFVAGTIGADTPTQAICAELDHATGARVWLAAVANPTQGQGSATCLAVRGSEVFVGGPLPTPAAGADMAITRFQP
jgi:hypothetical protein